ncbi:hypothetical protein BJ508DRAFT_213733 [Ascobolus immersus RN42]|uniref:Uncharacterized protein n=1 Tax=Ascobolus immersus RN42 TaxID=1160509 RepID=A0A3N4I3C0_ASCIM|nr:hypothetical protein BJ508DRAFT_213733 [Ascobolus immersus RN42]
MKFTSTLITLLSAITAVSAVAVYPSDSTLEARSPAIFELEKRQNAGRPVPNGACCAEARSLKQDVCRVNGQNGRCVPDNVNGCGTRLTCIEDRRLQCNPAVLERGRPLCRRRPGQ